MHTISHKVGNSNLYLHNLLESRLKTTSIINGALIKCFLKTCSTFIAMKKKLGFLRVPCM
jgi:hypothetical protein